MEWWPKALALRKKANKAADDRGYEGLPRISDSPVVKTGKAGVLLFIYAISSAIRARAVQKYTSSFPQPSPYATGLWRIPLSLQQWI